jgi:butyrate kinase
LLVNRPLILVLNVGSTSTKVALYSGSEPVCQEELPFMQALPFGQQLLPRRRQVLDFLASKEIKASQLSIIVSRGGLMKPLPAGIYGINVQMCTDLSTGRYGVHPSGLGPVIAMEIAGPLGIPIVTVDPPSTDEFHELARISGLPGLARKSAFHALSQKAAARKAAKEKGMRYEDCSFVVAHLGGGITVGAHLRGRVVDCSHGLSEGPFTPERAGSLPTLDLLEELSGIEVQERKRRLVGEGGFVAYLGTKDAREVEKRIHAGDEEAKLVFAAMAYQVAKEIGAMAVVLSGKPDGIVLTGGLSHSVMLVQWITERVSFLAPVYMFPENEMQALAQGALRVLTGEEEPVFYYK